MCYSYYDHNGSLIANRPTLNLIDGDNVTLTATDNPATNSVDITVAAIVPTPITPPSPALEEIARVVVDVGGSSTIDFTSIPSTFTALQLRIQGASDLADVSNDNLAMQFNEDGGTDYTTFIRHNRVSGVFSEDGAGSGYFNLGYYTTTFNANIFPLFVIDIPDYAANSRITTVSFRGMAVYTPFYNEYYDDFGVGMWTADDTITSITLLLQGGGNFVEGTTAVLYGYV